MPTWNRGGDQVSTEYRARLESERHPDARVRAWLRWHVSKDPRHCAVVIATPSGPPLAPRTGRRATHSLSPAWLDLNCS